MRIKGAEAISSVCPTQSATRYIKLTQSLTGIAKKGGEVSQSLMSACIAAKTSASMDMEACPVIDFGLPLRTDEREGAERGC